MTAFERFEQWYRRDGHWIYPTREAAMGTWKKRGIDGLPPYPGAAK